MFHLYTNDAHDGLGCEVRSDNSRCRVSAVVTLKKGDVVGVRSSMAQTVGYDNFYGQEALTVNYFSGFQIDAAQEIEKPSTVKCFQHDFQYLPDFEKHSVVDATACQSYCRGITSCEYFSFHNSIHECHLAEKDAKAYKSTGYTSGLWSCRPQNRWPNNVQGHITTTADAVASVLPKVALGVGVAGGAAGVGAAIAAIIQHNKHAAILPTTAMMPRKSLSTSSLLPQAAVRRESMARQVGHDVGHHSPGSSFLSWQGVFMFGSFCCLLAAVGYAVYARRRSRLRTEGFEQATQEELFPDTIMREPYLQSDDDNIPELSFPVRMVHAKPVRAVPSL